MEIAQSISHSIGSILEFEASLERQRFDEVKRFVSGIPQALREALRPYATTMEELYGPSGDTLDPERAEVLRANKRDHEIFLAHQYAGGDLVVGLNNFLYRHRFNIPDVRRLIAAGA